jgi:hypothetical protein
VRVTRPAKRPVEGSVGPEESAAQRRRRLDEVFGDVMPDTTSDERDPGGQGSDQRGDAADRWLREQVPPHHGQ